MRFFVLVSLLVASVVANPYVAHKVFKREAEAEAHAPCGGLNGIDCIVKREAEAEAEALAPCGGLNGIECIVKREAEAQHFSPGYVKYSNGAVTPEDTDSVQMAKAVHANAHVTAAFNGYKAPLVHSHSPMIKAVAPQVQYVATQYVAPKGYAAPTMQYAPLAHQVAGHPYMASPYVASPYVANPYVAHKVFKREAEAEAHAPCGGLNGIACIVKREAEAEAEALAPCGGLNGIECIVKREAEAEAESDAQVYYTNQYPAYGYPYGTAYGYNQVRYTAPVATRPFYSAAYPLNYASYVPQRVFKREPEAEADAPCGGLNGLNVNC